MLLGDLLLGQSILKSVSRKENLAGHRWWDFSLPANGTRWGNVGCEIWLREVIDDIQASGKWLVVGYTLSDSGEKLCLLAKDIRPRAFSLSVSGMVSRLVTEQDVRSMFASAGIVDIQINLKVFTS